MLLNRRSGLSRPFMLMLRSTLPLPQRAYPDRGFLSMWLADGAKVERHEKNSHDHQNNSHEEEFPSLRDGTIVSGIALERRSMCGGPSARHVRMELNVVPTITMLCGCIGQPA